MRAVTIDKKMFVRRVGVQANGCRERCSVGRRNKTSQRGANLLYFASPDLSPHGIDRRDFSTLMEGYFHTLAEIRKSVKKAALIELP